MQVIKKSASFFNTVRQSIFYFKPNGFDSRKAKGKIAAQAGHACVDVVLKALNKNDNRIKEWLMQGSTKICVYVDSEEELLNVAKIAYEKGIAASIITDAGMTEFHNVPTKTCLALEPLPTDVADELTGHLPLY